jgi:hypothetical protein
MAKKLTKLIKNLSSKQLTGLLVVVLVAIVGT